MKIRLGDRTNVDKGTVRPLAAYQHDETRPVFLHLLELGSSIFQARDLSTRITMMTLDENWCAPPLRR